MILFRFIVGAVFLSEVIQKFLFPVENGVGRFAKIGIPTPESRDLPAPILSTFLTT